MIQTTSFASTRIFRLRMVTSVMKVKLQPWSLEDLPLIQQLMGDPEVMAHLGGPETPEQIQRRNQRYALLQEDEVDRMFKILWGPNAEPVGKIGYWQKSWRDQLVYEMGWMILPGYQGRGIATRAGEEVIKLVNTERLYSFIHAFPSVSNPASNAICRKLGFSFIEECQFEYPPGHSMMVSDWRLDLLKT
jgi:RimJ/RimL family protein N-acetyltransferase